MAVVLLVEDEEQVRVLAESYLEQQGHKVLSAGSPQGAIALLEKTPHIDVLFTDLDLKGDIHAGIELAREAIKRWPHLKVLYAKRSARSEPGWMPRASRSICDSTSPCTAEPSALAKRLVDGAKSVPPLKPAAVPSSRRADGTGLDLRHF